MSTPPANRTATTVVPWGIGRSAAVSDVPEPVEGVRRVSSAAKSGPGSSLGLYNGRVTANEATATTLADVSWSAKLRSSATSAPVVSTFRITGVGTAASALAFILYGPWGWRRGVPLSDGFDVRLHMLFAKLAMHGNLEGTDRLGAPFGQHLQDFAIGGDRLSLVFFRLFGLIGSDPVVAVNALFILSFGLVAISGYAVARALDVPRWPAAALGMVYAFVPYHFAHDAMHVFLANYSGLTLVVLVAIWSARGDLRIPRVTAPRGTWTRQDSIRLGLSGIIIVVGGSSGGYYAAFGILILCGAGMIGALGVDRGDRIRILGAAGILAGALAFVMLANNADSLLWRMTHGTNHEVAFRTVADNERYGLHLTQVVLPGPDHRVEPLAALGDRARRVDQPGEPGTYLGFAALSGLVIASGTLLTRGLRRRGHPDEELGPLLGGLALWVFTCATVGGLGFLLAVLGVTQFRAWGRLAVVLALLGLLRLATASRHAWEKAAERRGWTRHAVLWGLVVIALCDQIPTGIRPDYEAGYRQLSSTRAFVADMEAALPRDAMVFQFPIATFPEAGPTQDMEDYSLLLPYLTGSDHLRWSYGGLKGREQDWQLALAQQPLDVVVTAVAASGFTALTLDRDAYADRGAAFEAALEPLTGPPVATSADGRLSWFDLRPRSQALLDLRGRSTLAEVADRVLHGIVPRFTGAVSENQGPLTGQERWLGHRSRVTLANPLATARPIEVHLSLLSPTRTQVTFSGFGGAHTVRLEPDVETPVTLMSTVGAHQDAVLEITIDGRTIPGGGDPPDRKAKLHMFRIDEPFVLEHLG